MGDQGNWTVLSVLNWTAERFMRQGLVSPRLDAEVLLAHCLAVDRIRLYVDFDKPLGAPERAAFRALVKRRLSAEPVAYITGQKEFWSLPFSVDERVLIPRPDTELLVEVAQAELAAGEHSLVVEVGTGSGAVAVALAASAPAIPLVATDVSEAAIACARKNAARHQVEIAFYLGSLLDALPSTLGSPSLLVSNLPYIPSSQLAGLMPDVGLYEPRLALDGGDDGLDLVRQLIAQAATRLRAGGLIALEIGVGQAEEVEGLLETAGFVERAAHDDLGGTPRVVSGRRPGPRFLPRRC